MGHDWIIDVLADVRSFARQNDMPLLSAQMEEAMLLAATEAANIQPPAANWDSDPGPRLGARSVD